MPPALGTLVRTLSVATLARTSPPMPSYAPPKLRQIVTEAVFRRKRLFCWTVFVVVGLVALGSFLMPKRYAANAKLMMQPVRSSSQLSTTPSERLMSSNSVTTEEINSEVDLLESQGVARRALGQSPNRPESKKQDDEVATLQHHLTVEAVHQANLIDVTLVGKTPLEASAQLRKVIEAYFEQRAGTAISTNAAAFFASQVAAKSKQLQDDQQQMTDFEVQHGIADLDDQKKLEVERIAGLQNQLLAAQAQLSAVRSKAAADKRELSMTPARSRTTERTITNQYSQEHLNTELVDLQNHLTELTKRYPPTDRQVVETQEKIETTKKAIAEAGTHPASEQATDANPVYQQLSAAIATAGGEASAQAAQVETLQQQMDDAKDRLNDLEQSTATYDALKRNLTQAQADYTLYAQKRDEARIAEALDKAKMFDVQMVQDPVASATPVRPKPLLYIAAGTVFALLLATLLTLYTDTASEQVYTPAQLDTLTGTRTIATLAAGEDDQTRLSNRLEYRRVLLAIRNALHEHHGGEGSGHSIAAAQPDGKSAGYCVAFVSALRGECTSSFVSQLAAETVRQGAGRIAVLDAGQLLRKFETNEDVGFAMKHDEALDYWVLDLSGADEEKIVPLRSGNVQGVFSARLQPLLVEMRKGFDFIFLDCPSLQDSTLAAELSRGIDGYVAVVGAGKARKQNIDGLTATLRESSAPLLGYVLTGREYPVPRWMHRMLW